MTDPAGHDPKTSFDDIYTAATPHQYFAEMRRLGYQIGEQSRPYCLAAARVLEQHLPMWPVQVLDVGCSYGVGAAFVKHGCTFEELVSFFASRAPESLHECAMATRNWLNVVPPVIDARVTGLDSSKEAIDFAHRAGLLERGLARNFENEIPGETERELLRSCNMLMCTGAVGYVTEKSFSRILPELGRYTPGGGGALAVLTSMRMYDVEPIRDCFVSLGYKFEKVEGARLPQRAFASEREQLEVIERLTAQGQETHQWEELGVIYADVYIAAWPGWMDALRESVHRVRDRTSEPLFGRTVQVASARASLPRQGDSLRKT